MLLEMHFRLYSRITSVRHLTIPPPLRILIPRSVERVHSYLADRNVSICLSMQYIINLISVLKFKKRIAIARALLQCGNLNHYYNERFTDR